MNSKISQRLEEFLLIAVIVLNILDTFHILKGDIDYLQKLTSWTAFGYVLYKISLTKLILGHRKWRLDLIILLSYFLFTIKDFTTFAEAAIERSVFFKDLLTFVLAYRLPFEKYGFYLAGLLLLFIALYAAWHLEVRMPSLMHVLHEEGRPPRNLLKLTIRFLAILLCLVSFFLIVFNLLIQWWVFLLDSPILVIGILFYLFLIIRHYQKFSPESLLFKIGDFGDRIYEHFIELFHDKRTLALGVVGLLSLHLFTDAGYFLLPYTFNIESELYFEKLGAGHTALLPLFQSELSQLDGIHRIGLGWIYVFNTLGILFLLIMPAFVWWKISKEKELHVHNSILSLIFVSLVSFFLIPLFRLKRIVSPDLVGVDIQTQGALAYTGFLQALMPNISTIILFVSLFSLFAGLLIFIIDINRKIRKDLFVFSILLGCIFFGFYIYQFFMSMYGYYIQNIIVLLKANEYILGFYLIIFAMITLLFYAGGFILFIYELFKKHFFERAIA